MTVSYKIRLHAVTPIHIGSGDVYDPTQFVIDQSRDLMHVFNTADFLSFLDLKKNHQLSEICKSMTLVPLFRFFKENFSDKIPHRTVRISSGLSKRYAEILSSGSKSTNVINQFELKRTAFNDIYQAPYIPGSSLKGSLKTAWISARAVSANISNCRNASELENATLEGSFSSDPFSFVKISDLFPSRSEEAKPVRTMIVYAVNYKKKPGQQRGTGGNLPVPFEIVPPGAVFEGNLNLEPGKGMQSFAKPRHIIDLESLRNASRSHYWPKLHEESDLLAKLGGATGIPDKLKEKFGEDSFLVRLGHHSGAESVTADNNRRITIRQGPKPSFVSSSATTIWLASFNKATPAPFGWVVLEFER